MSNQLVLQAREIEGIHYISENGKLRASGPDIRAALKDACRGQSADTAVSVDFGTGPGINPDLPPNAKCRDIGAL
jgi:hypothetical protein